MTEWKLAKNLAEVFVAYEGQFGAGSFLRAYPNLADTSVSASPHQTFKAVLAKIRTKFEELDYHVLNAAKRDLHDVFVPLAQQFQGDGGALDQGLCNLVASCFRKDFINANYLGHLSTKYRYLYVAVPKSGFTKIKRILQEAELGERLEHPIEIHDPVFSPLLEPIDDVTTLRTALTSPDWFRFGIVRNPFTRILSCYLNKVAGSEGQRRSIAGKLGLKEDDAVPSFGEFLRRIASQQDADRDIHWASQHYLLCPDVVNYSFVGHLENVSQDLGYVLERLSITPFDPIEQKEHAAGASEKMAQYYRREERKLVAEIFSGDFEAFGYDPDALPQA